MTTAYLVSVSALFFGAGAAAAWRFTALHYRSRQNAARMSAHLFRKWWERDSGKMLIAQAELDLIAEQRRSAGRQSHKAERAVSRETARTLAMNIGRPDLAERIFDIPAEPSAASIAGGTGLIDRSVGQDTGAGHSPDVTPWARTGNEPGQTCSRNRAGYSAPAEFSQQKGA